MKRVIIEDEYARALAEELTEAVDFVMREITEFYKTHGSPCCLILGEYHEQPVHTLAQILILHNLKNLGFNIACGLEIPSRTIIVNYEREIETGRTARHYFLPGSGQEPDHNLYLRENACHTQSVVGLQLLFHFLSDHKIPTSFNDAAKIHGHDLALDVKDKETRAILRDLQKSGFIEKSMALDDLHMETDTLLGIHARNQFMAKKRLMKMNSDPRLDTGLDFYVQIVGSCHIGDMDQPWAESLPAILQENNVPVLAVPFQVSGGSGLPAEAEELHNVLSDIYIWKMSLFTALLIPTK